MRRENKRNNLFYVRYTESNLKNLSSQVYLKFRSIFYLGHITNYHTHWVDEFGCLISFYLTRKFREAGPIYDGLANLFQNLLMNAIVGWLRFEFDQQQIQISTKITSNWLVDLLASRFVQITYNQRFDHLFDAMIMNASFHYLKVKQKIPS